MHIWICNGCHAEIAEKDKPKQCPLCGQGAKGFDEGEREDPPAEDKKYSRLYDETLKKLEEYEEGCEPRTLKFCSDE